MHHSKHKGVLVIIFIVLLLGGLYFFSTSSPTTTPESEPTPTTTPQNVTPSERIANPMTVRSEKYAFSMQYPADWRLVDFLEQEGSSYFQLFNYAEDKYVGGEQLQPEDIKIETVVIPNPEKLSPREFAIKSNSTGQNASNEFVFTEGRLGTEPAVIMTLKDNSPLQSYWIRLDDETLLVATAFGDYENRTVDAILQTFSR
jgi:hypothetical protein